MPLIPVVRVAVDKTVRAFSDGSGALPRAMMLPRSKSRSATIFSTMRSMLIAMAMGAGGSWQNYMEHYDMMDAAWLSNGCSDPNLEIISSGGRNSRWAQLTHAAEGKSRWKAAGGGWCRHACLVECT